jgi:hypothetical protein
MNTRTPRRAMTDLERERIKALISKRGVLPHFPSSFVFKLERQMRWADGITESQADYLERLTLAYRKQLPADLVQSHP